MKNVHKPSLIVAFLFGFSAVLLGAFGAHGLESTAISESRLEAWKTGVNYQFIHTFALLFTGLAAAWLNSRWLNRASWLFILGIILFSGSLYGLGIAEILGLNLNWLGPVTPLGGLMLAGGWLCLIPSLRVQAP